MRRVVIASADASREAASRGGRRLGAIMVTLTYREEAAWDTRDVTTYVRRVREYLRRRGIELRYQWVIELTARGRPHYHCLFWLPLKVRLPKPDQSGQWDKGSSRIERARRAVGYLVKYATKGTDGRLPKGARLFGTGAPEADVRLATHRAGLPTWLDNCATPGTRCKREVRLGWVEVDTGEVHQSPFALSWGRDPFGFVVITVTKREPS